MAQVNNEEAKLLESPDGQSTADATLPRDSKNAKLSVENTPEDDLQFVKTSKKSSPTTKHNKSNKSNKQMKNKPSGYNDQLVSGEDTEKDNLYLNDYKPIRKDANGNIIQKKKKKHKITFQDQLPNKKLKLVEVQMVESFKEYNKEVIKYSNNSNKKLEENANTNCSCSCTIF